MSAQHAIEIKADESDSVISSVDQTEEIFVTIDRCRACGSTSLRHILDLGRTPLADGLLTEADLKNHEPRVPLNLGFCEDCTLIQIMETVRPDVLFNSDYPYFSSVSSSLLEHSKKNAEELIEARKLGHESLVVELASNDGYLLKNYVDHGIPVLGIDPSRAPGEAAIAAGVPTLIDFFGRELAGQLAQQGKRADVVHGNNVLAHVADLNGFVAGIATILKDDGVAVLEFPYLIELLDKCEFDTIYHQHLCYFSMHALDNLFRQHGLFVNDVRLLPIHGGSLRLFVGHKEDVQSSVTDMLAEEKARGFDSFAAYRAFGDKVRQVRKDLTDLLNGLKSKGKSIAAYGAAAKGTTLLSFCGLNTKIIEFVADKNAFKQGRYMPGSRLPIVAPERLLEDQPDYVLLLPWNFADEILAEQAEYRSRGGKFIIPIPSPKVA